MVLTFSIGDEKELSIPLIMGAILYATTLKTNILYGTILYGIFATISAEYFSKIISQLEKDEIEVEKLLEAIFLLGKNLFYVKDNQQMSMLRGLFFAIIGFTLAQTFLTYESVLYLANNYSASSSMLVLLLTTIYSVYRLYNTFFGMTAHFIFDIGLRLIAILLPVGADEELEKKKLG